MDTYNESRRKDWEDLEVTKGELKTLTECLKKEGFCKLLSEYMKEVTDPENRKIYEKEIIRLEKERGVDVTFVNPEPGYVIKTSANGDRKCFLNICKSNVITQPSSQPAFEQGHRTLQWSIPYSLLSARDDLDKNNVRCVVFDVVFHPDTIYLSSKNAQFRESVNNTAMDGVENNFKMKLDRKNLKFPNLKYKGLPLPAVIRKPSTEPATEKLDIEPAIYQKLMADYDQKREQQLNSLKEKPKRPLPPTIYRKDTSNPSTDANSRYVTPKFSIKHQSYVELEDFSNSKTGKMNATVPKKLIVTIDLPLLKTATDASLDVQERYLSLKSEKPAKYLLDLPLTYRVDADSGNAKFDPKYKKLVVTLPVVRPVVPMLDTREDSGVDSDRSSPVPLLREDSVEESSSDVRSDDSTPKLVEECETVLTTTNVENESESFKECSDRVLRTSDTDNSDTFLDPDVKYSLPAYICNIYDDQLAITVNVKNVDPNSIRHRILKNNLGIHVSLTSVGAGFFPQCHSLCLKIYEDSVVPDSFASEPWDNNVVFTVALRNTENLGRYYVGLNEEFMEERNFPTATFFKNQLKELTAMDDLEAEKDRTVNVQTEDDGVVINIGPSRLHSDNEAEQRITKSTQQEENPQEIVINAGSISESIEDKLTSNSTTVSESSTDENGMPASSIDCHYDSEQDVNSETDCSSLKKTVRFNEMVSQRLFRSKSSILHQSELTTVYQTVKQSNTKPENYQNSMTDYDQKRERQFKRVKRKPKGAATNTIHREDTSTTNVETNSEYFTPKFSIKYKFNVKLNAKVPKKLIVTIDLPLLQTDTDVLLDVQERYLRVKCDKLAKYLLELPLPYSVDVASGDSRFDTKYKKLVVTLTVIPTVEPILDTREDSGVDSDHGSPLPVSHEDSMKDSLINGHTSDSMPKLVDECETVLAATKVENESESLEECSDSALRTGSIDDTDTFLNSSNKYSLPPFTCSIHDNRLTITVNVKNVDPNSIRHRILQNNLGIHISLTSVSAELFLQHYSLCLKIDDDTVDSNSFTSEVWDNNVIFTVAINNPEHLTRYYVGVNDEFMEEKVYSPAASFRDLPKEAVRENTESVKDETINGSQRAEDVTSINPNRMDSDDEVGEESTKTTDEQHAITETRFVSENNGDEFLSNNSNTRTVSEKVLRSRSTHNLSRSVSESSADENGMATSSVESDCSSLKKTVRFNKIVSRQLFRSASSILQEREKRRPRKSTTVTQTVKPILKQDKQLPQENTSENVVAAEFNNDLIFDLDM
ncbi:PIH1 domain-containing protein Nop17-like isoform X2 [Ptiloglossa arizonensis]|uniref:PIH1 domain-containing protein Nop17-like isoform X2 n=1 Tax=Ptiloglossa arizonensis TaxID=3350558 RepID=UPI003FA0055C